MTLRKQSTLIRERAQTQLEQLGVSDAEVVQLRLLLMRAPLGTAVTQRCEVAIAAMVHAEPSETGLIVSGPSAQRVASVYCAAALLALESGAGLAAQREANSLLSESAFILGRESMKAATLESAAARRSADAKRGAPPKRFSDDALRELHADWLRRHGYARGWMKHAAHKLDVTERTISARWKEITGSS